MEDETVKFEVSMDDEKTLSYILEMVRKSPIIKRVILEFSNVNDKAVLIEKLREFLSTNISKTVVVHVKQKQTF